MLNKPKILIIGSGGKIGGADKCLLLAVKNLYLRDYRIKVLLREQGGIEDSCRGLNIPVEVRDTCFWIRRRGRTDFRHRLWVAKSRLRNVIRIAGELKREKYDLVYTWGIYNWDAACAAKIAGVPHIFHVEEILENDPDIDPFISLGFSRKAVRFLADRLIADSRATARGIDPRGRERCEVVHNAIEPGKFRYSPEARSRFRNMYRVNDDDYLVGYFGGFSERKGVGTYLQAAQRIAGAESKAVFLLAGAYRPSNREAVIRTIDELGLGGRFRVIGHQDDMPGLMSAVDLVCLPSVIEPFGILILEAWEAGRPVVATRSGGPEEIISHMEDGVLVETDDPRQLAEGILGLLQDPARAREMTEAAKIKLREKFSPDEYVRRIREIIESVLSGRAASVK